MNFNDYLNNCTFCSSRLIQDYSKGEIICENCGCVVKDQVIDHGPEFFASDTEEKNKKLRASGHTSYSLHDYGLRTEIGFGTKDYSGKSISHNLTEQINTMRKWHSRIRVGSSKERRLSNILTKINETCSMLMLPKSIIETAAILYRNFESKKEAKGKSISCMAAASIHLACKKCSIVRSMEEIVCATGISQSDRSSIKLASKYYRQMVMELGTESKDNLSDKEHEQNVIKHNNTFYQPNNNSINKNRNNLNNDYYSITNTKSSSLQLTLDIDQYISKLANVSRIDTKIERLAIDMAHKTYNNLLADGKAPNGLAAAYIYLASVILGVNLLQVDISNYAGVTEVTIRNRCKDILAGFKLTITVNPYLVPK